jgi:hypothetical protein
MSESLSGATSPRTLEATSPLGLQQVSTKPKKLKRYTASERQQEPQSNKDLSSRKVGKNTPDRIDAFEVRTSLVNGAFSNEKRGYCFCKPAFPQKISGDYLIYPEIDQLYTELSQLYQKGQIWSRVDNSVIEQYKDLIKTNIFELIAIKQEIIATWNKYNPDKPYKYGRKYADGIVILEDQMLEIIQVQLYICYDIINDDENKLIIIDQLIEQKSEVCFHLLNSMFIKNITDYEKIDNINFTDILTTYAKVSNSFKRDILGNNGGKNNQIATVVAIMKLFLDKSNIDYHKLTTNNYLRGTFLELIATFASNYIDFEDYKTNIQDLSLGVEYYYKNLDNPIFKGIHTTILSDNGIVFVSEFSKLFNQLLEVISNYHIGTAGLSKTKALGIYAQIYQREFNDTRRQTKELLRSYNITTTDFNSWYDTIINTGFIEIFYTSSANSIIQLARWIDVSTRNSETPPKNIEIKDNIKKWLNILEKDYKSLANDTRSWEGCPEIILKIFCCYMKGNSLGFTFSTPQYCKDEELAILNAKIHQTFFPFLGTALLAIAHKDSYDDLLDDIDMLEFISKQTDKTKYVNSSKYLIAQIITYLLDKNNKLTLDKKQYLFNKAEKLYLEMADLGINRAYLLLAETTASLAKEKMYSEGFLKAAKLYDKASSYCNVLSVVDGIESELQDLAIINMNCFSAEADVLRKLSGEQQPLLQKPTTPVVTATGKNNSSKQKAETVETNEPQELAEEVTAEEVQAWQFANEVTSSKPISGKATKVKTQEVVNKSFTRKDIVSQRNFWKIAKELHMSGTNLEKSYSLIEKLIQCDYFNILVAELRNGTTGKDSWMVPFLYQNMAYYHFLQQKYAKEIGNNMKLFHVSKSSTEGASKAEEADFANVSAEAEYLIRQSISLICPDIPDVATKNIRDLLLSLSSDNYGASPHKRRLAAIISTYGHLISLDDVAQVRRGKDRLAAKLYDKADEINPARVLKKLEKKVA